MTIENWQATVDDWVKKYGVRYFDVTTNTLLLSEEVGEFSRLVARSHGEQSFKIARTKEEIKTGLADELGDILFVITCLANQMNINLTEELQKNMNKKTVRDHKRHIDNPKLGNALLDKL